MKKYYKYLVAAFILVISVSVLISKASNRYIHPEYKHSGKCITCEKQFNQNARWIALSNKCYDCEKDLIDRSGGDISAAYNAVKSKCFDC